MAAEIETIVAHLVEPGSIQLVRSSFELGPHEVAVQIAACGICSWESQFYTGVLPTAYPRPMGHEGVGVVAAVGAEVKAWRPGDRVTGLFGPAFATFAKAREAMLVRVPDDLPLEQAIIEPVKCIVTGLRAARPDFGDHALVVGCGFMGLMCLAGLSGARLASLTAVDVLDERLELAKELGAAHVLNPRRDDVETRLREITGGHGIDVAMEATAGPAGFVLASRSLRRGRPTMAVVTTALRPETYDFSFCQEKGAAVHFAEPAYCLDPADELRRSIEALGRGVFPMQRLITHRFGLDEIGRGIEMGLARSAGYIKGIVIPKASSQSAEGCR